MNKACDDFTDISENVLEFGNEALCVIQEICSKEITKPKLNIFFYFVYKILKNNLNARL